MNKSPAITILCRLTVSPAALAAIDRMAQKDNSSREKLLSDFASWLALAESPPAVAFVKDLAKQVIADRRGQ